MLGLASYRLGRRSSESGAYDFTDPETGHVVGLARRGQVRAKGWSVWAILGLGARDPARRPRLCVGRPDGEPVFVLRKSSGLMYDSRRVYDGRGELIAHLRSHFKSPLREGFGIIDLRGVADDCPDIGACPSLGRVHLSDGVYRVFSAAGLEVGRIDPRPSSGPGPSEAPASGAVDSYEIAAGPELEGDPTGQILLLASALSLAWPPPMG